jgi:hypothetical protein
MVSNLSRGHAAYRGVTHIYNDATDFGGLSKIESLTHRSLASIKMKIQNIVAMLDEAGIQRYSNESPLTGLPQGQSGRKTNWEIVEPLCKLSKQTFLQKCRSILS